MLGTDAYEGTFYCGTEKVCFSISVFEGIRKIRAGNVEVW